MPSPDTPTPDTPPRRVRQVIQDGSSRTGWGLPPADSPAPTPRPLTAEGYDDWAAQGRPVPLTAEQVAALGRDWATMPAGRAHDVLCLVATVEQLQAEVDRLTADLANTTSQRDAAGACLRRWYDDSEGTWFPDRPTVTWELVDTNDWVAIRRESMTPAEADALARAAQPQEGT